IVQEAGNLLQSYRFSNGTSKRAKGFAPGFVRSSLRFINIGNRSRVTNHISSLRFKSSKYS
ncbi:MAG TPA: hypothetical protein VKP88_04585, partial [Candidatus Paceibacterota bacterium]|nr:hypothetical protein [Candidatus Paceibacterota bacterium]